MQSKPKNYSKFFAIFLLILGLSFPLSASLLISPLQVVIEGRNRSSEIVLINPSQDTNTYRISWEQLKQVDGAGGYIPETEQERQTKTDLEDFAVFTPRQVTLEPNQKQTVRIAVRRPAELADGEYKSHIKFSIVPNLSKKAEKKQLGQNERSFGATVYASYSIPVIYRTGEYDINVQIGQPSFSANQKTGTVIVDLPVSRSGKHGAIGLINIYYTPSNGEQKLIASHGNANLFPEINQRLFKILTTERQLSPGTMKVQYLKAEGDAAKYQVLAERVFQVGK